jgi:TonB family protein
VFATSLALEQVEQNALNTYTWDWAPWVKGFQQNLHNHWNAPHAYKLGIISGDVALRITVEKNGHFSEIKIVSNTGHQSFVKASVQTVEKISPAAPLPETFSEEHLIITLSLHYPPWEKP